MIIDVFTNLPLYSGFQRLKIYSSYFIIFSFSIDETTRADGVVRVLEFRHLRATTLVPEIDVRVNTTINVRLTNN